MWLSSDFENDNVLRIKRETRCRKVLLNRSIDISEIEIFCGKRV